MNSQTKTFNKCFHIVEWDERYESNKTRNLQTMRWVAVPNSIDTNGVQQLLKTPDGIFIFGFWILILQLASRCYPRGYLICGRGENAHPYTIEELANKYYITVDKAQAVISVLLSKEIGWLEEIDYGSIGYTPKRSTTFTTDLSHFDSSTLALLLRLGYLFGRKSLDEWTNEEKEASIRLIATKQLTDHNVCLIEKYYKYKIKAEYDYRPKSLITLLMNFRKQVDISYYYRREKTK